MMPHPEIRDVTYRMFPKKILDEIAGKKCKLNQMELDIKFQKVICQIKRACAVEKSQNSFLLRNLLKRNMETKITKIMNCKSTKIPPL